MMTVDDGEPQGMEDRFARKRMTPEQVMAKIRSGVKRQVPEDFVHPDDRNGEFLSPYELHLLSKPDELNADDIDEDWYWLHG